MSRDRSSVVRVRAEVADAVRGLKDVAEAARGVGDQSEQAGQKSQSIGQRVVQSARDQRSEWQTVGAALTTYGAAVTGLGTAVLTTGISYNTLRQTTHAALTTLLGDTSAAADQMDRLDDFATNSPFARQTFITAQQQMLGFGVEANKVIPALDAIQNAVAAFGGSNEQISAIAEIMSRIQSEGRLSGDALQRLGYYGIDAAQLIGDSMGMTSMQIRDMASRPGGIPVSEIWDPLVDGMQTRFGGAADNVKETFEGAIDRVKAAFRDLSSSFAAPLVGPEGGGLLVDGLNRIADAMRAFESLPDPIRNTGIALGLLTGPLALVTGGFMLAFPQLVNVYDSLGRLQRVGPPAQAAIRRVGSALPRLLVGGAVLGGLSMLVGKLAEVATSGGPSAASVDEFRISLERLDMVRVDEMFAFGGDVRDLDSAFTILTSNDVNSWMERLGSGLAEIVPGFRNVHNPVREARDAFEATGDALAALAGEDMPAAVAGFAELHNALGGTDEAGLALLDLMPGLRAALVEVAGAAGHATDDATLLRIILGELSPAAEEAEGAIGGTTDSLSEFYAGVIAGQEAAKELEAALHDNAQAFIDWSGGLDEATFSLDAWFTSMEEQAVALADYGRNFDSLIDAGYPRELLAQLQEMGPAGAQIVEALANGTEEDMARAIQALLGINEAEAEYVAAMLRMEEASTLETIIRLDADTDLAYFEYEAMTNDFESDVNLTGLGLDTGPAQIEFAQMQGEWEQTETPTMVGADPEPAMRVFNATTGAWERATTDTLLDLDPSQAVLVFNRETGIWERTTVRTQLDANTNPARSSVGVFKTWAGSQSATITVRAFDQPARNTIASLSRSAAGGSYAYGGFTGDGGKFEPAGIVHRGEYVMPKEQTAVPAYRSILEAMHRGTLNLPGYANGGQVGTPVYHAANRQAAPHVTVQPAQIGDVHARLHPDSVRDVARELGREVLAGARDVSQQSLRLTARSASGGSGRALV